MGSLQERSPRPLLLPLSLQGHWTPFKQLIRHFVAQKVNFTVWTTPRRAEELKSYEASGGFQGLEVECQVVFTDMEEGKAPSHFAKAMEPDLKANKPDVPPFKFSCVISDMFLGELGQGLADDLGIPRYSFSTSPAHFAFIMLHGATLVGEGLDPSNPAKRDQIVELPGLDIFTTTDLPEALVLNPQSYIRHTTYMKRVAGVIINSFEDFDGKSLDALRCQLALRPPADKVSSKVYAVGPLLLLPDFSSPRTDISGKRSEYFTWLDARPKSSVLFICFGSQLTLPPSIITEIAKALESTKVSFLWALRTPTNSSIDDICTLGFESRTGDNGLVVTGWVPQQELLGHPSIGGFLSHCGWNSILESISAGVPIVAGPMWAEQGMNARFMVDQVKIAVEIKHKGKIGEFDGEAIAEAITTLMEREEGVQIRQNMLRMQKAAYSAVADDGPAHQSFRDFVAEISSL